MTATTPASRVVKPLARCPIWCDGHTADAEIHSRDLPGVWGAVDRGPVLGLALERADDHLGAGSPRISVQISHDGVLVDDELSLGLVVAEDYAVSILRLVAAGRAAA